MSKCLNLLMDLLHFHIVDYVLEYQFSSRQLQDPHELFLVQEMLESTAELDHSLRMKAPLLHLTPMTSPFVLIQMLLLLQTRISSWTAFMGHKSLKVLLVLIILSTGTVGLLDTEKVEGE